MINIMFDYMLSNELQRPLPFSLMFNVKLNFNTSSPEIASKLEVHVYGPFLVPSVSQLYLKVQLEIISSRSIVRSSKLQDQNTLLNFEVRVHVETQVHCS